LPFDEVQTSLVGTQQNPRSANRPSETQFSFGTEIEETFDNASFIRPPGFVKEAGELTSLLLTTSGTENNDKNTKNSTEHECYAGIVSKVS